MQHSRRRRTGIIAKLGTRRAVGSAVAAVSALGLVTLQTTVGQTAPMAPTGGGTSTPIKHLVVIFQENVSFDHYFGTYPYATNADGEPFYASPDTPKVNNLLDTKGVGGHGNLLNNNPNTDASGTVVDPQRLDAANVNDLLTCDQDHDYNDEQKAFDNGAMDKFVTSVGTGPGTTSPEGQPCNADTVMNYYDGNTVTGLWNYAQNFAMSDNSFGTTFGPSAPGAINLVSGDTGNVGTVIKGAGTDGDTVSDGEGGMSLVSDAQPYYDDCSTRDAASLTGTNIGDELNGAGLSWGWFQGGFTPSTSFTTAATKIGATTATAVFTPDEFSAKFNQSPASNQGICNTVAAIGPAVGGTGAGANNWGFKDSYIPHHEPFQYYQSTANPHHLPPASLAAVGTDTQSYIGGAPQFNTANHQYDTSTFDSLVSAITHGLLPASNLPAVSFLKAPGIQDGHAAYSDPLDEQQFIVHTINELQSSPDWKSTAVVISYDDSDGFYDHVYSGVSNASSGAQDFLTGTGSCGDPTTNPPLAGELGRCGFGPRLPLMVISPFAKHNFVDHTQTTQSSITRFIEDNWNLGRIPGSADAISGSLNNMFNFGNAGDGNDQGGGSGGHNPKLYLDPTTGEPTNG